MATTDDTGRRGYVMLTDNNDGSAKLTVNVDDEDYRFSVVVDENTAILSYEETLSYRAVVRTSEPSEEVWEIAAKSDTLTNWVELHGLEGVRIERQG